MGVSPGALTHRMPPQPDDQQRRIRDMQRQQREDASARSGQAMQVGAGGILVNDGGGITIEAPGQLNLPGGVISSAAGITATTFITAGTTVTGQTVTALGTVNAVNVSATGQVVSTQPLKSPGSHGYNVSSNYVAAWINGDGTIGTSQSSPLVKTALTPITAADVQKLLALTPYWGRYVWDAETVPPRVFLLSTDVQAAGFGPDVAPTADTDVELTMPDGKPILDSAGKQCVVSAGTAYAVNYSQLVVPLLAALKTQQTQLDALTAQVAAINTKLGI